MKQLSKQEIQLAKYFLYDIFWLNGVTADKKCKRPPNYYETLDIDPALARMIFLDIKLHNAWMGGLAMTDHNLHELSNKYKALGIAGMDIGALASYIAYFCKENKIYWSDKIDHWERKNIVKTYIGKALTEFECFASQHQK